jgi:ElaB/YqjD/DUF883 family membrane-anchored ribosome-binding protein
MKQVTQDDLIRDLRIVVDDLEALVNATRESADEKVIAARGRADSLVNTMKERLREIEHKVIDKARSAALEIDTYVRDHAWETIAAAAKAGVFLGVLLHDRKNRKS